MKTCRKCGVKKSIEDFGKTAAAVDGRANKCRVCVAAYDKQRYLANPALSIQRHAAWVANNREYVATGMRQWRLDNKDRANEIAKKARSKTLIRRMADNGKRRAIAKQATPVWTDMFFIQEAHRLARLRTKMTGIPWKVDHIVPLRSRIVCGLHAHTNIQVIPKQENLAKRHWRWPDMPE